jgi:hypothetical protein
MIYALEFFWVAADGCREEIARETQRANSLDVIESRARAIIRNVLLGERRANFCVIKNPKGKLLSEVSAQTIIMRSQGEEAA